MVGPDVVGSMVSAGGAQAKHPRLARLSRRESRVSRARQDRKSTRLNSSHLGIRHAARSTLFPYTTLFQSVVGSMVSAGGAQAKHPRLARLSRRESRVSRARQADSNARSEESRAGKEGRSREWS